MEMCVSHIYQPALRELMSIVHTSQAADPTCSTVINYCRHGWPDKNQFDQTLIPYWKVRGELTVHNHLLLRGSRIVVPQPLQKETLQKLHQGHQGIQRCRLRARSSVWWPAISKQINDLAKRCPECVRDLTPHCEPLIPTTLPDYPWQKVASDLFQLKGAVLF